MALADSNGRPLLGDNCPSSAQTAPVGAAAVMCNDFSARDVQLEKGQFYESKSYPTFTPTGPGWSCWTRTTWPCCIWPEGAVGG
jgi:hypothetical protein